MSKQPDGIQIRTLSATDGGPAFPASAMSSFMGMSLRDYFAAKAMAAMTVISTNAGTEFTELARRAYSAADKMLAERAK